MISRGRARPGARKSILMALGLMTPVTSSSVLFAAVGVAAVALSVWIAPGVDGLLGAGLALLMLAIAVIDFRHQIIPNELNAAALALALLNAALLDSTAVVAGVAAALLRGVVTMLLFWGLRFAYGRWRGREGLGLGDVKLAAVAGAWLDWVLIPVAVEIAALAALVMYLAWPALRRQPVSATERLPFGLFFAPAIWLTWLLAALLAGAFGS